MQRKKRVVTPQEKLQREYEGLMESYNDVEVKISKITSKIDKNYEMPLIKYVDKCNTLYSLWDERDQIAIQMAAIEETLSPEPEVDHG